MCRASVSCWLVQQQGAHGPGPALGSAGSHTCSLYFLYTLQTDLSSATHDQQACWNLCGWETKWVSGKWSESTKWRFACSLWDVSTLQPNGHIATAHHRSSFSCPLLVPSASREFNYSKQWINRWPLHTSANLSVAPIASCYLCAINMYLPQVD